MFLTALTALVFIFGLCIGSFLNVVIFRIPVKKSITKERSFCPKCKAQLRAYDMIPVISFIFLKGLCRSCHQRISWQYPLVELFTALLFTLDLVHHYLSATDFFWLYFIRDIVFICFLIVIFVMDFNYYLILDKVTIPAMGVAVIFNTTVFALEKQSLALALQSMILAAIIGGGFFLMQFLASKGKWVGGGDIRLGIVMGLMLGFPHVVIGLFIAYVGGAIVSLGLIAWGQKKWRSQVPFGTFLAAATVVTLLYADKILAWYISY